jgi:hypothetical protein
MTEQLPDWMGPKERELMDKIKDQRLHAYIVRLAELEASVESIKKHYEKSAEDALTGLANDFLKMIPRIRLVWFLLGSVFTLICTFLLS